MVISANEYIISANKVGISALLFGIYANKAVYFAIKFFVTALVLSRFVSKTIAPCHKAQ
ncbi:MAG: hypothetical protein ACKVOU_00975 [Cytophagales bacterium]